MINNYKSCYLYICMAILLGAWSGCGEDDGENSLKGSALSNFPSSFDRVDIFWQEQNSAFEALIIKYINSKTNETPVKIVVNKPVSAGVVKDFTKIQEATLSRIMQNGSSFGTNSIKSGTITIDQFSTSGAQASGSFGITFNDGSNIIGRFSGIAQILTANTVAQ